MVRISSVNLSSTRNAHTGQETYRVRIEMRGRKNSNERTDMPCRVLFNASNELIFNGPVRRVALHLEIPFSMISFSPILALSLPTRILQLLNDYDGDYREKSAILFQMNGVCDCAACSRLRKEWVDEFARRSTQMQTKKKWQTPERGIHSIWLLWFGRWLMRWCVWSVEGALHSGFWIQIHLLLPVRLGFRFIAIAIRLRFSLPNRTPVTTANARSEWHF